MRAVLAAVTATMVACSVKPFDLDGLACKEGRCAADSVCHPETDTCVAAVAVGCEGDGICPSETASGDPCPSAGSFLPCADGTLGCEWGCRTCREDGTWSECSAPTCAAEVCDGADNDCDGDIDNGLDACQCSTAPAGAELCDGVDNDCDGSIDEGFECLPGHSRDCDGGGGPGSGTELCDDDCQWSGSCLPDGAPPARVTDLAAADGEQESSTIVFTTPDPVDECVLLRSEVGYATGHSDTSATQVTQVSQPGQLSTFVDSGLVNGTRYYYAAFCALGGFWNDDVVEGENADAAVPGSGLDFESASSTATAVAGTNVVLSHRCSGANRALLVGIVLASDAGQFVDRVQYPGATGNSFLILLRAEAQGNTRVELWGRANPAEGTHDVEVKLSSPALAVVGAASFVGVDPAPYFEAAASASGSGASTSMTVTPTLSGALVVDVLGWSASTAGQPAGSPDAPQILRWSGHTETGASDLLAAFSTLGPVEAPGDVATSWTLESAAGWAAAAVVLRPAAP